MIRLSTFDLAKQRQQFVRAGDRVNCSGCRHSKLSIAERTPDGDKSSWRCMKGGFFVTAFAICQEHEPVTVSQAVPGVLQRVRSGEIDTSQPPGAKIAHRPF